MDICRKAYFFILLSILCCVHTGCCGYSADIDPNAGMNADDTGGDRIVSFFDLPLSLQISFILATLAGLFAAVKFYPPLAGRIKSVLDNERRKMVFEYISENPGRSIEEIASGLNLKRDTLRYHVKRLNQGNYIVIENTDNTKRIFPNHMTYTDLERRVISICHNPTQLKIISLISNYPGIRNSELKDELGISKSAVSWHINRLENAGILSCRKSGRAKHYYIKSGLEDVILNNLPEDPGEGYGFSS